MKFCNKSFFFSYWGNLPFANLDIEKLDISKTITARSFKLAQCIDYK